MDAILGKRLLTRIPSLDVRGGTCCWTASQRAHMSQGQRRVLVHALLCDRSGEAQLRSDVWGGEGGLSAEQPVGESDVGGARTVGFFDVPRRPLRRRPVERLRVVAA